jgi:hypothetical protein
VYNNVFQTRGYVKVVTGGGTTNNSAIHNQSVGASDPDLSAIDISVVAPGSGVNLLLTDPNGNKTGIDNSGAQFQVIPNSVDFLDGIAGLNSSGPPADVSQYVSVSTPELGNYEIELSGIDAGETSFNLIETAFAPDGSQLWSNEIPGTVGAGAVDQYSITYAVPEPGTIGLLLTASLGLVGVMLHHRRAASR